MMKNVVLFIISLFFVVVSYGQDVAQVEQAQSCIMRKGDRYTVGGMTYYNSTAFRNYLKNTNPDVFAQYDRGYRISMAGWGLFAYGVALIPTSVFLMFMNQSTPYTDLRTGKTTYYTYNPDSWSAGCLTSLIVASAALCASIPMLGVGYHKMHQAVDVYNVSRQPQAHTFWSIEASGNGIGVAYNF